jgi:hypothetical protein
MTTRLLAIFILINIFCGQNLYAQTKYYKIIDEASSGFNDFSLILKPNNKTILTLKTSKTADQNESGTVWEESTEIVTGNWKIKNNKIICSFDKPKSSIDSFFHNSIFEGFINKPLIVFSKNSDTVYIYGIPCIRLKDPLEIDFFKSFVDSFTFDKYMVSEIYEGKIAKLDQANYKNYSKEIRELIISQYNKHQRPDFAGHYIIVTWACGSTCQMNAIIDAKTGKTISSFNTALGIDFKINSCLIILNPPSYRSYDKKYRRTFGLPEYRILKKDKLTKLN